MKRVLIAAIAATITLPAAAQAQTAGDGWRGCFLGVHFSQQWADTRFTQARKTNGSVAANNFGSQSPSSGGGGLQVGCDYQSAPFVYGFQVQHDTGLSGFNTITAFPTFRIKDKIEGIETITGRFGYMLSPETLAYVRGGFAVVRNTYTLTSVTPSFLSESAQGQNIGYAIGGGLEWTFDESWSVYGEFLHTGFGSFAETYTAAAGTVGMADIIRTRQSVNQLMLGVNFHFK